MPVSKGEEARIVTKNGLDPVTTELIRSKIDAACCELRQLLFRSAYSTLMRESRDCSIILLGPGGEVVTPGEALQHCASYRFFINYILSRWDPREGDIFLSNHPYESGVYHTPDLAIAIPVFADGQRIGFSCSIAHKSDVGGAVVGSASSRATEIFQEGLLLPVMRAGVGDEVSEIVMDLIRANVRNPDLYLGDMRAQLGVTRVGRQRLQDLAGTVGTQTLLAAYQQLLTESERALEYRLRSWPEGRSSVEGCLDSDGVERDKPVHYRLDVEVRDGKITLDATRSDNQTTGPVNMPATYAETCFFYGVLAVADPTLIFNDGMRRVIDIKLRKGSVLSPDFPGAVGAATVVHHRLIDVVLEALAPFSPATALANGGGSGGTLAIQWKTASTGGAGSRALQYEVLGTATGGMDGQDGCDGTCASGVNLGIAPVEVLEAQFPVRITRFDLIPDSAGPGRFRGGLSYRREYEFLADGQVNRRADRERFPGNGILGGQPGQRSRLLLARAGEEAETIPGAGIYELSAGDRLTVEGSGAGGYGDPHQREPQAVARDVADGYVSREAALSGYGVVITPEGTVDVSATERVRGQRLSSAQSADESEDSGAMRSIQGEVRQ